MNQWRYQENRWEGNKEREGPGFEPDRNNIADKTDVKDADNKRHDAGHQQRHKE